MKKQVLDDNHFRVALFGSARIKKDDVLYQQVYDLAGLLAKEGIDIITGGGQGLMDATSSGHHAQRGKKTIHSIGLTINLPKEQKKGYHLDIEKDFSRFSNRLDTFMSLSHVVVVAPGGIGTMLEFFYTWQLLQVNHICHIPLILWGDMWKDFLLWIHQSPFKKKLLDKQDLDLLYVVRTKQQVLEIVHQAHEAFLKGGTDFCLNYTKYRLQ